jgi:hypothetical protein
MGSAVEKYMGIITIGMSCANGVEKGPRAAGKGREQECAGRE